MDNFVIKDENLELPVPLMWRESLESLANSFVLNKFPLVDAQFKLAKYDTEIITLNFDNISDYPEKLGLLSERSWDTSIFQWVDGYWEVLIDLSNEKGEIDDSTRILRFHHRQHCLAHTQCAETVNIIDRGPFFGIGDI